MPRSTKQNEEMRAATRSAVLDSAMKLFAQRGYGNTTTRSIANDAQISTGLMYHYFENKESLLRNVFENCIRILSERFTLAYEQSEPVDRLANLLRTMFAILVQEEDFWSLFYMLRSQPAIMQILGDDFRKWTEDLRRLFETELQQLGRQEAQLDALLLYSLVEGTIQQYLLDPGSYPLDRVVQQIIAQYGKSMTKI